jgi:spoIIIJ-associated protein
MLKRVFHGKTVKDAKSKGLLELGVTEDQVKVTVLEQPAKGIFGWFGVKEAKVEIEFMASPSAKRPQVQLEPIHYESFAEGSNDAVALTKLYLFDILRDMGLNASIEDTTDEDGNALFHVSGGDLGILIGRRGQTLDAMQLLINVYANRLSDEHIRIILDAERFRERRKKTLQDLSLRLANQVIRTKKEVVLEPMSSHERRIIHFQLQNHPKVKTFSKGDEPNRRIVITLK